MPSPCSLFDNSKKCDATSGVQRKTIGGWADANEAEVVKFTFDLSTSGGTSAFQRKGLGPWLTEPGKIAAWDVVVGLMATAT